MTVFATVDSLLAGLLTRAWRELQRVNPLAPAPRVQRRYPRGVCPVCGRAFAVTSRGVYKHRCRPAVIQADTMRRSTAGRGALGASEASPSADTEIRGGTCDL